MDTVSLDGYRNRPYDVVIWDFDGTIADTTEAIEVAIDSTLVSFGRIPCDHVKLRSMIGLSLDSIFTALAPDAEPHEIDAMRSRYRAEFTSVGPILTKLFPGVSDLLAELSDAAIPSAVATSKGRAGVTMMLDQLDIAGRFVEVVSDDDVKMKKPDPEMVLKLCSDLNFTPARALVIGDTVFDVEMGQRAGADTCAVTWGNQTRGALATASPDFLVDSVAEIAMILEVASKGSVCQDT